MCQAEGNDIQMKPPLAGAGDGAERWRMQRSRCEQ